MLENLNDFCLQCLQYLMVGMLGDLVGFTKVVSCKYLPSGYLLRSGTLTQEESIVLGPILFLETMDIIFTTK